MTLTRKQVEASLVSRLGSILSAAGLSTEAVGENSDLNDAIASALLDLSITPSRIDHVVDADVASVSTGDYAAFLDLAEYRMCGSILGNLSLVDITIGPRRERLGQLAAQVERKMERLKVYIEQTYGVIGSTLDFGNLDANFSQQGDDEIYGVTL